jgi:acyl-coenzyme A thioesterase PaaI-like protein
MKIQFMRPVTGDTATCEGRFTKKGRSISYMESRLFDTTGKLAALATATWKMP